MKSLRVDLPYTDENKTIRIVPTSCQHFGSKRFHKRRFVDFLSEQMAVPQSYLILMGDVFDTIIPADNKRYDPSDIEPKYLVAKPGQIINLALNEVTSVLYPYKDNIVGILTGNHEWEYMRRYGLNITQMLCDRLGCRNLGMSFLMWLQMRRNGENGKGRSLVVYGHHGYGGGSRTAGGGVTKYEKQIKAFDADLYLFGHDHDTWKMQIPRVGVNKQGNVTDKPVTIVCCGTFKRSLSDDEIPTWEEKMGFGPKMLKGQVVELTARTKGWIKIE